MSKINRKRKKRKSKIGLPPGSLVYTGHFQLSDFTFRMLEFDQNNVKTSDNWDQFIQSENRISTQETSWIHITGLNQVEKIKSICERFHLSVLSTEDILNSNNRTKFEEHSDYILITFKIPYQSEDQHELNFQQVSVVFKHNTVISFSEAPVAMLEILRERI